MIAASFLFTLFLTLAIRVNATSSVTSPLTKVVNPGPHPQALIIADQLRMNYLKGYRVFDISSTSAKVVNATGYVASVGVGCPPTFYSLLIDSGSSNTWLGAGKRYVVTDTSTATGEAVAAVYGSGEFSGDEFLDLVTISPNLQIHQQSIGVAAQSAGFTGFDGIIGLGPVDLTVGTLPNKPKTAIPTVVDNLYSEGAIIENLFSLVFAPTTNSTPDAIQANGEITWGGIDLTKIISPIEWTDLTTVFNASLFWGVNSALSYGNVTIMPCTAGIVDSGTTLILIPNEAFGAYQKATGAVVDANTGLLKITPNQYKNLKSLFIQFAGTGPFELIANAQIFPRSQNVDIGGISGVIYLIVSGSGVNIGSGLDFIWGLFFFERVLVAFDATNKRVGVALTINTFDQTN